MSSYHCLGVSSSNRHLQPFRVWASSFQMLRHHTQGHTTVGRTPLDEGSARRRDLYLTNTQHSQQTNIHAPGGIWTRDPSKRPSADPCLRPLGHWDRQSWCLDSFNFNCFARRNYILVLWTRKPVISIALLLLFGFITLCFTANCKIMNKILGINFVLEGKRNCKHVQCIVWPRVIQVVRRRRVCCWEYVHQCHVTRCLVTRVNSPSDEHRPKIEKLTPVGMPWASPGNHVRALLFICGTSDLRRAEDEAFALLGCYSVWLCICLRSLWSTSWSHLEGILEKVTDRISGNVGYHLPVYAE